MPDQATSLQNEFLGQLLKGKMPVTVFLISGVKLQGVLTHFDAETLLLRREAHTQLVYKHSISTIMPNAPLSVGNPDLDETGVDLT